MPVPAPDKIARLLERDGDKVPVPDTAYLGTPVVAELTDGTIVDGLYYCTATLKLFEVAEAKPEPAPVVEPVPVKPVAKPAIVLPVKPAVIPPVAK